MNRISILILFISLFFLKSIGLKWRRVLLPGKNPDEYNIILNQESISGTGRKWWRIETST